MKIIVFNNRRLFMVFGSAVILAGIIWAAADHRNLHWFQNPNYVLSGQYFASSNAWIALGGSWTADASGIGNTSEERGAKLIARDRMWKNIQIDADIQIAEPFAEAGFIIRSNAEEEGVDAYHGYLRASVRWTHQSS